MSLLISLALLVLAIVTPTHNPIWHWLVIVGVCWGAWQTIILINKIRHRR